MGFKRRRVVFVCACCLALSRSQSVPRTLHEQGVPSAAGAANREEEIDLERQYTYDDSVVGILQDWERNFVKIASDDSIIVNEIVVSIPLAGEESPADPPISDSEHPDGIAAADHKYDSSLRESAAKNIPGDYPAVRVHEPHVETSTWDTLPRSKQEGGAKHSGATDAHRPVDLPEGFQSASDSVSVAVGVAHTCALEYRPGVEFGGAARCWGHGDAGHLEPPGDIFIQLSAGDKMTCGVRLDQTLVCWGHLSFSPPGLFLQVAVGSHHVCALTVDGKAVCWGDNIAGCARPPHTRFVQLAAGADFSCGIRRDGLVECWGSSHRKQTSPPKGVRFKQLSASASAHACGLTLGGDIQCWGGLNSRGEADPKPGPWLQVSCGLWTTCGIREENRTVECWGFQTHVQEQEEYEEVATSDFHTCAVNLDGDLRCWGGNSGPEMVPDGFQVA